jgi:hypothetical protein
MRNRSSLLVVVGSLVLVGCVGSIEPAGPLEAGPDADPAASDPDPTAPDAAAVAGPCDEAVAMAASGKHKPGEPCLSCHRAGGPGPAFTLAGTAYTTLAGGTPVVGATVHVVDATGADVALVTARNGNFWTAQPFAFPVTVRASRCPETRPMIGAVSATGADCNRGGCHTAGFRIYLP